MTKDKLDFRCGSLPLLAGLWLAVWALEAVAQQGHRIIGSQVVVEGRSHWENWQMPANSLKYNARNTRSLRRIS